jgi:hypothetical protein
LISINLIFKLQKNSMVSSYDLWNDNYDLIFHQKYYSFLPFKNYKLELNSFKIKKNHSKTSLNSDHSSLDVEAYLKKNNFKISKRKPWNSSF